MSASSSPVMLCVEVTPAQNSAAVIDDRIHSSQSVLMHRLNVQNSSTDDNIDQNPPMQFNRKPISGVGSSSELLLNATNATLEQNWTASTPTAGEVESSAVAREENSGAVPSRGAWGSRLEFLMTMIGNAVGLGNVWRFPYLCYRNGGGAFLVPYFLMLLVVAMPLYMLETAVGQFGGVGITLTFGRAVPLSKGIGFACVVTTGVVTIYYNVIVAECLYFFVASVPGAARLLRLGNQSPDAHWTDLPWTHCDPAWATQRCHQLGGTQKLASATSENETRNESTKTPTEEYFERQVLKLSSGLHEMGGINWQLLCANLVVSVVCGLILIKGVKSLGKSFEAYIFPIVDLLLKRLLAGEWEFITLKMSELDSDDFPLPE